MTPAPYLLSPQRPQLLDFNLDKICKILLTRCESAEVAADRARLVGDQLISWGLQPCEVHSTLLTGSLTGDLFPETVRDLFLTFTETGCPKRQLVNDHYEP